MIFQDPMTSFNPVYRVGDQIVEAIRAHRDESASDEARERAIELLDSVGIPDAERRVDDYPHEFSGGMRQRAMIAMALALEPEVLIADEPTTALDVTIQAQILDLLERAQPRARPGDDPDHPRPRRRRRGRRPGAGHVRGAGGRAGHPRRDLLRPPAPLHLGPARLADPARPSRARSGCRRSAARRRRCSPSPRAAPSGRAARTSSSSCTELPALEARLAEAPGPPATAAGSPPSRSASGARSRAGSAWRRRHERRAAARGHRPGQALPGQARAADRPRGRPGAGGRRGQLQRRPRRDARPGRRVGQRQVDRSAAAILQLLKPTSGSVRFEGREIAGLSRRADAAAAARDADDLPGPLRLAEPAQAGRPDRRRPAEAARASPPAPSCAARSRSCSSGSASRPSTTTATRTSSPAASASGSGSPGRWRCSRS